MPAERNTPFPAAYWNALPAADRLTLAEFAAALAVAWAVSNAVADAEYFAQRLSYAQPEPGR